MQLTAMRPMLAVLSLASAEHGHRELLRFRIGEGELGVYRKERFGAGRAEAGVALVPSPKGWRRVVSARRRETT